MNNNFENTTKLSISAFFSSIGLSEYENKFKSEGFRFADELEGITFEILNSKIQFNKLVETCSFFRNLNNYLNNRARNNSNNNNSFNSLIQNNSN